MAEKKKEYKDFSDMFDGGGPGRSGDTFEGGGIISTIGNALGGPKIFGNAFVDGDDAPGGGIRVKHSQPVPFFVDAFDGGGFGDAGNYFSDAPYSILANILGSQPKGSENLEAAREPNIFAPVRQAAPVSRNNMEPVDMYDMTTYTPGPSVFTSQPPRNNEPISSEGLPPTFSEFIKFPSVQSLSTMAQMRMYDALYGIDQGSTPVMATGGMGV